MDTYDSGPLIGPGPEDRERLNRPMVYAVLSGVSMLTVVALFVGVQRWLAPPAPPAAPVTEVPAMTTPTPPLEPFIKVPTTFANLDRRPQAPPLPPMAPLFPAQTVAQAAPPVQEPPPLGKQAAPAPAPALKAEAPAKQAAPPSAPKKEWGFLAQGTQQPRAAAPQSPERPVPPTAAHLIDPAVWAIPARPERTLYRTQLLPCEVLALIDTDAPGQIQLRLTTPVFGFYGQGEELFPKESRVIGKQAGTAAYGHKTIAVKLEQVQLPSGAIVEIPGEVGGEDGSNQLKGKTNNHWDTVFLSAVANALVSLGGGYLTGTPGRGQYYQDPAQQAMAEASRSVQQDTKTIIGRELKRGPTITRDPARKGERFCTIQLLKNLQFSDAPQVVKVAQ